LKTSTGGGGGILKAVSAVYNPSTGGQLYREDASTLDLSSGSPEKRIEERFPVKSTAVKTPQRQENPSKQTTPARYRTKGLVKEEMPWGEKW